MPTITPDLSNLPLMVMQIQQNRRQAQSQQQEMELGQLKINAARQELADKELLNQTAMKSNGDMDVQSQLLRQAGRPDLARTIDMQYVEQMKKIWEEKGKQAEYIQKSQEIAAFPAKTEAELAAKKAATAKDIKETEEASTKQITTTGPDGLPQVVTAKLDPKFKGKMDPQLVKRNVNLEGYSFVSVGPSEASAAGVIEQNKQLAKGTEEAAAAKIAAGNSSRNLVFNIDMARDELKKIQTDAYAPMTGTLNKYLTPLGVRLPAGIGNGPENREVFLSSAFGLTLQLLQEQKGSQSDKDFNAAMKAGIQEGNVTLANDMILRKAKETHWRNSIIGNTYSEDKGNFYKNAEKFNTDLNKIPYFGKNAAGERFFFNEFYDKAKERGLRDPEGKFIPDPSLNDISKAWRANYAR